MLTRLIFSVVALVGAMSFNASASFVNTDWKVEGDSKVVLHTETGLEWLKLSETRNMTYVDSGGVTRTATLPEHYNNALATTLAGWRMPTENEVRTMLSSFFDIALPWQSYSAQYAAYAQSFTTLFGTGTYQTNYTLGMWYADSGQLRRSGVYVNGGYSVFYGPTSTFNPGVSPSLFLVSDGGLTFSSINDPSINANNPNAPVAPADVNAALYGMPVMAILMMFGFARRRKV